VSATEWLVAIGGITAIAWVNWYFFLAARATTRTAAASTSVDAPSGDDGGDNGDDTAQD
jgi:hypothetical protein